MIYTFIPQCTIEYNARLNMTKYSRPLNNMGLNCKGPLGGGLFLINIQSALGFASMDSTNHISLNTVFLIRGRESMDAEG